MLLTEYLKDQLDQLSYDASTGIAYGSIRLTARLCGVDESSIRTGIKGAGRNTTRLRAYLDRQGFEGAGQTAKGLSAGLITAICRYYDKHAEQYCTETAAAAVDMLNQIGLTVAIKQAIGVQVDDRSVPAPVMPPDFNALMAMLIQQQAQINALLAGQVQTTTQQVVKRSGVAAEVQALRCEAAQIWAKDGYRDPKGAKRRMALLDAQAEALLREAAEKGDYVHLVRDDNRSIATKCTYRGCTVYRVPALSATQQVPPLKCKRDRRGRLRIGRESRMAIQTAASLAMQDFDADLLHGGFFHEAILSPQAIVQCHIEGYSPHLVIAYALKLCGFVRCAQADSHERGDCPLGRVTGSIYARRGTIELSKSMKGRGENRAN